MSASLLSASVEFVLYRNLICRKSMEGSSRAHETTNFPPDYHHDISSLRQHRFINKQVSGYIWSVVGGMDGVDDKYLGSLNFGQKWRANVTMTLILNKQAV